jgi:hypothetical protein
MRFQVNRICLKFSLTIGLGGCCIQRFSQRRLDMPGQVVGRQEPRIHRPGSVRTL